MDKLITFQGVSSTGEPLVQALFPDVGDGKVKVASFSRLHPEMQKYVDSYKPRPGKLCVLVNALGAGEYYGSNVNADYFEEAELDPQEFKGLPVDVNHPSLYGHQTFLRANVFRHHKNKDPGITYGQIVKVVYNDTMHRVELIIEIDRRRAEELGYQDLLSELDAGGHPAVSMGARVKYDVCSICGNKSFTRQDYCMHMKTMRNQVLPDGRKVFVYNPKPKFFDLSFVIIGADKTSYAMLKVAFAQDALQQGLSADAAAIAGTGRDFDRRILLQKMAEVQKKATITKRIPSLAHGLSPHLAAREPDMDMGQMQELARQPIERTLTSTGAAGMVLKPSEFQTIVLIKMRQPRLAREMWDGGRCFAPESGADMGMRWGSPRDYYPLITRVLSGLLGRRSALGEDPGVGRPRCIVRVVRPVESNTPLLTKVAEGYNGYRIQLLEKAPSLVSSVTSRDGDLLSTVFGEVLEGSLLGLEKSAGIPPELLTDTSLAYLYGAHHQGFGGLTKSASAVDEFVERHPVLAASLLLGLVRLGNQLHRTGKLGQLLRAGLAKLT